MDTFNSKNIIFNNKKIANNAKFYEKKINLNILVLH